MRCKVRQRAGSSRRLATTVRVGKAKATRTGRRAFSVTVNANRRLRKATAVRVQVRSGSSRTAMVVRAR